MGEVSCVGGVMYLRDEYAGAEDIPLDMIRGKCRCGASNKRNFPKTAVFGIVISHENGRSQS